MKNKNLSIRKVVQYLNNPENDGGFWLPNIQRPFVWSQEQIEKLFDSLMREYPISTMLVWRTRSKIKRRKFIDNYRDDLILSQFQVPEDDRAKLLVLDGQQRLQSLYISLCGSHNKEELFFNVLSGELADPDEVRYKFRFLSPTKGAFPWVNFKKIVFSDAMPNLLANELVAQGGASVDVEQQEMLVKNLWQAKKVFVMEEAIGYQELDSVDNPDAYTENDVVEIFIRANSGGTKLGKSDLLFSLLTASWDEADEAMEDLISELNASGYEFTRDFVLKTCLVLLGKGAAYDVKKFRDDVTKQEIVAQWPRISAAIRDVRDYLYRKTFIRSDHALPSYLTLIPVIYFRFHYPQRWQQVIGLDTYLLRTLLCGAFSGRPDGLIDKCVRCIKQEERFSVDDLFEVIHNDGRNLDVSEESLLQASYGSKTIHLIFNLWYRQFDYQPAYAGNLPQVDHIFPQSLLRSVKDVNAKTGRPSLMRYQSAVRDQLANCMLLTADENGFQGKCDVQPKEWFADKSQAYLDMHLIPAPPSLWALENFEKFIAARRRLIISKLRQLITAGDVAADSAAPDPADEYAVVEDAEQLDALSVGVVTIELDEVASVRSPVEPNNLHEAKNKAVQVSEVEALLDTYCTRIAEPTKYIAGFRTMDGKEIALEREGSGITLWTQYVSVDGAEIQPVRRYADTDTRNSNLNRKNCPALRLGNRALVWKLVDRDELLDFINWYGGVQLVA
ncbi:DUF262 domain-containing protein [Pseudomonas graminis]|uniref:DUF262 domain-containing protein n=1 Tax=Pseudomonas graminis TaxID=158627 RepID=UPI002349BF1B|nr:DUF262 domain-containing protein [Pseudomonas graminis]MDC6381763.1 DUF262 domain-containing protein [Pseudomonas graminis]